MKYGTYGPLLASMLCLPAASWAKDECAPTQEDPATRICLYQPHQRYVLHGLVGFPVNLEFGNGERIKRDDFAYTGQAFTKGCTVGAGQTCLEPAATWKTVRAGAGDKEDKDRYVTNLPIWPFAAGHSSLVVVTASETGAERPYLFDLWADDPAASCKENKSAPGCPDDQTTVATMSFAYPAEKAARDTLVAQEKKKAAIAAWQQQQTSRKEAAGVARLKQDVFYGQRQWRAWRIKGEPQFSYLDPKAVSDNGQVTLMQWPENVEIPTITIVNKNVTPNEVRIAPVSFQGRIAVIGATAEWFRLTLGRKAVHDLHNPAFSKDRPDPGTGTNSPDVLRTVIMQKAPR